MAIALRVNIRIGYSESWARKRAVILLQPQWGRMTLLEKEFPHHSEDMQCSSSPALRGIFLPAMQ